MYLEPCHVRKKKSCLTVRKEAHAHADFSGCLQDFNSLEGTQQLVQMMRGYPGQKHTKGM